MKPKAEWANWEKRKLLDDSYKDHRRNNGFTLFLITEHGLQCYHCVSTKSWDDCASIQKKVACDSGKETCANIHYHSKSGDLAMSEERYARKCSAKSACGNEELCKAFAPKGATIKKCKVNCCEGNLCNGARVPLASAILLLACALSAFFCSGSANCEVLSFQ